MLGGVAGEISDCGIDLAERNLHIFSVKQERGFGLPASAWTGRDLNQEKTRIDLAKISGINEL